MAQDCKGALPSEGEASWLLDVAWTGLWARVAPPGSALVLQLAGEMKQASQPESFFGELRGSRVFNIKGTFSRYAVTVKKMVAWMTYNPAR